MKPKFLTFTGLDARTDLDRVEAISARYPVEWGILLGSSIANRYPDDQTIINILRTDVQIAGHFCGNFARAIMKTASTSQLAEVIDRIGLFVEERSPDRFQINSNTYDMKRLTDFQNLMDVPVIMQVRGETFPEPLQGITYLHDPSGGRGIVPTVRPTQKAGMPLVGYAGGIGPDNVLQVIEQIDAHDYYLDGETKYRTDDWLDLDLCEAVCRQIWPERK